MACCRCVSVHFLNKIFRASLEDHQLSRRNFTFRAASSLRSVILKFGCLSRRGRKLFLCLCTAILSEYSSDLSRKTTILGPNVVDIGPGVSVVAIFCGSLVFVEAFTRYLGNGYKQKHKEHPLMMPKYSKFFVCAVVELLACTRVSVALDRFGSQFLTSNFQREGWHFLEEFASCVLTTVADRSAVRQASSVLCFLRKSFSWRWRTFPGPTFWHAIE